MRRGKWIGVLTLALCAGSVLAAEINVSALGDDGWYSDDTRADGTGSYPAGTNLISNTLTADPEATASGSPAHNGDITSQITFGMAPGTVPMGTYPGAAHLKIGPSGSGKSQISHRKNDLTGHCTGAAAFGPGMTLSYSWMGNGASSITPSVKFGVKTSEFGSTGVSGRTGENVWDKVLIYEPGNLNGGTSDGFWHTETVNFTTGTWWFFDRTAGAGTIGTPMTLSAMTTSPALVGSGPKTVADVYALITAPGAIVTSVQFGVGSGNADANVYVNELTTNFYRSGDKTTFGSPPPVHNVTQNTLHPTIQSAIDAANSGDIIEVAAGTYAEDVVVSVPVDLRGPNFGISPNGGIRGPEAVIVPATNAPNGGELIHVQAGVDNVRIDGFTLDGDNPVFPTNSFGFGGADMHCAEGVTVYADNVDQLAVSNNIIKNMTYFGVTLYGGYPGTPPSTTGHVIAENLFQNLGTYDPACTLSFWGGGVLLYNSQYAAVTDNVMVNVRIGVQTGNFYAANPGASAFQRISGNTISARRRGIFHNLAYSAASPYTLENNSFTAVNNANETKWDGILLASLSVPSTTSGNTVDGTGAVANSAGIQVWNVKNISPAAISGGSISNVAAGIFLNNFEGYSSDGTDGAHATLNGVSISSATNGIRVLDSPSSVSHANVQLTIGTGVVVTGGITGLSIENANASVTSLGNLALSGQSGNFFTLLLNSGDLDATSVSFNGSTGALNSLSQNFAVEGKLTHFIDNAALGFIRFKAGETFVTAGAAIQRGIDAVDAGDIVHVEAGTYAGAVDVNKVISVIGAGSDAFGTIITNAGSNGVLLGSGANAVSRVTLSGVKVTGCVTGVIASSYNTLSNVVSSGNSVYGLNLNPLVDLVIQNSKFNQNGSAGMKIASTASVDGLVVTGSEFNDNSLHGWYADASSSIEPILDHVTVTGTSFNNNVNKGIYTERLSNALFSNVTVNNSGTGGAVNHRAGFDFNLKWRSDYTNITIQNSSFTNCGTGDPNGAGLLIKARNDGGSYSPNPATLGSVTLTGLTIASNGGTGAYSSGIRIGEANNAMTGVNTSPSSVVVSGCSFSGNNAFGLRNAVVSSVISAENNWWGDSSGPLDSSDDTGSGGLYNPAGGGDPVSDGIDYFPWIGDIFTATKSVNNSLISVNNAGCPATTTVTFGITAGSILPPYFGYNFQISYPAGLRPISYTNNYPPSGTQGMTVATGLNTAGPLLIDWVLYGLTASSTQTGNLFTVVFDGVATDLGASITLTSANFRGHDGAGQVNFAVTEGAPVPVAVDGDAPVLAVPTFPLSACLNADFAVSVSGTDNSSLSKVQYRYDNTGAWVDAVPLTGLSGVSHSGSFMTVGATGLGQGAHSIQVRYMDSVCNTSNEQTWAFNVDTMAPVAPTALVATPDHEVVHLTWTAGSNYSGYRLYGKLRPGYPYYNDGLNNSINDGLPGVGVNLPTTGVLLGTFTTTDPTSFNHVVSARGVYDYQLVAFDCAPNPTAAGNIASATNYFLGDWASSTGLGTYDGSVCFHDVNFGMSLYYGLTTDGTAKDHIDVAPTSNNSALGLPGPDHRINFEDLIIMAINYRLSCSDSPLESSPASMEADKHSATAAVATLEMELAGDEVLLNLSGTLMGYSAFIETNRALTGASCTNGLVMHYAVAGGYMIDVVSLGDLLDETSTVYLRFAGEGELSLVSVDGRDENNNSNSVATQESGNSSLPTEYNLEQNFPNPFNPVTTLRFALPETASLDLSVYNTIGQKVATVVSGTLPAGWHEMAFDGSSLSSGVYYVRLTTAGFQDLKKMVLVK